MCSKKRKKSVTVKISPPKSPVKETAFFNESNEPELPESSEQDNIVQDKPENLPKTIYIPASVKKDPTSSVSVIDPHYQLISSKGKKFAICKVKVLMIGAGNPYSNHKKLKNKDPCGCDFELLSEPDQDNSVKAEGIIDDTLSSKDVAGVSMKETINDWVHFPPNKDVNVTDIESTRSESHRKVSSARITKKQKNSKEMKAKVTKSGDKTPDTARTPRAK